jgi:hypothetical protein
MAAGIQDRLEHRGFAESSESSGRRKERRGVKSLFEFVLRFLAAILSVGVCVVLGIFVFWLLGGFLFHRGIIDDSTLFAFTLRVASRDYCRWGVLCSNPGWQGGFKVAHEPFLLI